MRSIIIENATVLSLVVCLGYITAFCLSDRSSIAGFFRVLLGFPILLYFSGASLRIFLRRILHFPGQLNPFCTGALAFDFLLSFLVLMAVSVVLALAFLFYDYILVGSIAGLVVFLNVFSLAIRMPRVQNAKPGTGLRKFAVGSVLPLVILAASPAVFGIFFRAATPFPSISGWDMYSALGVINWITSHHGYKYVLIPAYSGALLPYPAPFFFIISSYGLFLGVGPHSIYWYSVYPLIFFYMSLVYLVALGLSKNPYLSLTCAFVAFFAGTGFAEVVRNPLYLTLDMVGQLFFLLIVVFHMFYQGTGKRVISLVAIAFLTIFNLFTTIAVLPFVLYIALQDGGLPFIGRGRRLFRITTVLMGFALPVFMYAGSLLSPTFASYLSPPEGPFPISLKEQTFAAVYPPYFLALFLLSLAAVVIRHFWMGRKQSSYLDIVLYICVGFIIYFQPAYITYRIEFYTRVFMAVFISGLAPLETR